MLLTEKVVVKWQAKDRQHYEAFGYKYTKQNDCFEVDVSHLKKGSHVIVEVKCDYCGDVSSKEYKAYIKANSSAVCKDSCQKCQQTKTKECNVVNYGYESHMQTKEGMERHKKAMIDALGVDHNMKIKSIHEKAKHTMMNKPLDERLNTIKKRKQTFEDRFGGHPLNNEYIKAKTMKTNIDRLGVPWVMQNKKVLEKARNTMLVNGNIACSRQQKYICDLLCGELNYQVGPYNIDIAFPEEKIGIEYDGNGHNLCVKLGTISQDEFSKKENYRYSYLKDRGWKILRMISVWDYIPSDEIIQKLFLGAKTHFEKGNNYCAVDFGKSVNNKHFGRMRKLKPEDIDLKEA